MMHDEDMSVDEAARALRRRGFVLESLVTQRGEFVALVSRARPGKIVLGVQGRGPTVEAAVQDCITSWSEWSPRVRVRSRAARRTE